MATDTDNSPTHEPTAPDRLEMPAPTMWPIVLAAAITMLGMGLVTSYVFSAVGAILFVIALGNWLGQLLPGRGHHYEELAVPADRARPVEPHLGEVEQLRPGMAGHRMRIPEKFHPYSAGAKGGIIGGVAMTVPALLYGVLSSHHSLWWPVNLLAGLVLNMPRLPDGSLNVPDLERFHLSWLLLGIVIHGATSVGLGLIYGVLLPMLPGRPIFWGGVVAPLLWTGAAYSFMGVLNPALQQAVYWPTFIVSQFIYGIVVGLVVRSSEQVYAEPAGSGPEGVHPENPHSEGTG